MGDGTYRAIESKVNLVKSAVTSIVSFEPNLAHLTTNCDAISCISSNMSRIARGPNAAAGQQLPHLETIPFRSIPGISTRCAISQLCSPGYAVKSPSLIPFRICSKAPDTIFVNRFSSETSSIKSRVEMNSLSLPPRLSLNIGPVMVYRQLFVLQICLEHCKHTIGVCQSAKARCGIYRVNVVDVSQDWESWWAWNRFRHIEIGEESKE